MLPIVDSATRALAIGVLVAGVIQVLFQLPSLYREGYLPKIRLDFKNAAITRVYRLMLPAVFSVSVAQINLFVNTVLASFLVTGSVSWLYYSDRLMEFPVGVFGIALATVVLPSLSKENAVGDPEHFAKMLDWALRWVVVIAVPATVALYVLAIPLLTTIFQYNAFTVTDVAQSALALKAFAVGVCGFIFVKVLAPGFFARQDTKTPMKIAVVSVLVNVILSLVLVKFMVHTGLALAISIAAWLNAILLFIVLWQQGVYKPQAGWLIFLARVMLAVAAMSACLFVLMKAPEQWYAMSLFERVWQLSLIVATAGISYLLVLLITGLRPQQLLLGRN